MVNTMNKNKDISAAVQRAVDLVGNQSRLAELITASGVKVSQPGVQRWVKGTSKPKLEYAIAIERVTNGKIKAIDVRPDLSISLSAA